MIEGDFVQSVLKSSQEKLERRYHLMAMGYDFEWLVGHVAKSLGIEQNNAYIQNSKRV